MPPKNPSPTDALPPNPPVRPTAGKIDAAGVLIGCVVWCVALFAVGGFGLVWLGWCVGSAVHAYHRAVGSP